MKKKSALGLALILALVATASAQGMGPMNPAPQAGNQAAGVANQAPVAKSIEGKLLFVDESPALQAKDKTYILHFPRFYYYAYTEGFKAGDQMKLDGYELPAIPGQDKPIFIVTKAVVNGKTYDFTAAFSRGMMRGQMDGRGMGGMMMGNGAFGGGQRGMGRGRW